MRVSFASFTDLLTEARRLREAGDQTATVELLEAHVDAFPLHRGLVLLSQAAAQAQAGQIDAALGALDRALAAGCRFKKEWLIGDARLAPLGKSPRFAELVRRFDERYAAEAARAKADLAVETPTTPPPAAGYPLLMALHGNNSDLRETLPLWRSATGLGWVVAVPQSAEIGATPGSFTWNDRERTASQVRAAIDKVVAGVKIDRERIVLGGFSMGGLQAIALPIAGLMPARGIVSVAAWLPHIREFTELVDGGAGRDLRAYVVVGERDPSADGARQLVELLDRHGAKASLDLRPRLGHEYPDDMPETLERALKIVG